jgi:hypothetical protein
MPKLATQIPRSGLERIHGLPRNVPIPNDRNEHLAELHVLRNLTPHNGNEPKPRILEILPNDLRKSALNLMIDPRLPLLLHATELF